MLPLFHRKSVPRDTMCPTAQPMVLRYVMIYARDLIRVFLFPLLEASGWISLARDLLTSTVCEVRTHGVLGSSYPALWIGPVPHLRAPLAEFGCLRVYRDFSVLPHNAHRTGPTARRPLADRTGAMRDSQKPSQVPAPCACPYVGRVQP